MAAKYSNRLKLLAVAAGTLGIAGGLFAATRTSWAAETKAAPAEAVKYPAGFRGWTHVKSMLIYSDKHPLFGAFAGIHHVYANAKALAALKGKTDFPTGSEFAFDLLEAKESDGAYTEGDRKFVAVIVRDAKKYADTEGWGWQVFVGGDQSKAALKTLDEQKACATCHKEAEARHFVFTEWRD